MDGQWLSIQELDIDWQRALSRRSVYFYTSGSTGQPKKIDRSMAQLLNEGRQVLQTFKFPKKFTIFASVSHQHLYGLTFGLLLPFMSKQSFFVRQLIYPEQIEHQLQQYHQQYPDGQMIVISSPALLERCAGEYEFGLACRLFSSGGRLAVGVSKHYRQGITEIYGSSETGVIAHRGAGDMFWQQLSDVKICTSENSTLMVQSKRAFCEEWVDTQDLVAISEQGFELLGRIDRIIKLEEKRLSLDEVECTISGLEMVDDCHVLVVEHRHRAFLSVAVVLSSSAKYLLKQGKKTAVDHLRQQLKHKLEPIATPKHWRFVERLPRNAQSKLDKQWVKNLFLQQQYPHSLSQRQEGETAYYRLQFSPELLCFKGHFDEFAIYPAVGQIAFINHFAKMVWTTLSYPCAFEQMKFQSPIRPYDVIDLTLRYQGSKVMFELTRENQTVATGRIVYA